MGKKGESQLDWIMSLALFLLYIAWFFVFLSPTINFQTNSDSLVTVLQSSFENEFRWQLRVFPLFIETNKTGIVLPVIMNHTSNITDFVFMDGTNFLIWEDKLIFLANITSPVQAFWIIEGGNQTQEYSHIGLNLRQDQASTENMSVEFKSSLPYIATHKSNTRIRDIGYFVNSAEISPSNYSYNDSGFAGIYSASTGNIKLTTWVFPATQAIYFFIGNENPESSYALSLIISLDRFSHYYSDTNDFGEFIYSNISKAVNYTGDYVTLYDSAGSLSIFLGSQAHFNFTDYNTTLTAQIDLPIGNGNEVHLYFHEGNFSSASRDSYSIRKGTVMPIEGIYIENLTNDYNYLKSKWKIPGNRNFRISVYHNTSAFTYLQPGPIFQIGDLDPKRRNAYSYTSDMFSLEKDGSRTPISVNYRVW